MQGEEKGLEWEGLGPKPDSVRSRSVISHNKVTRHKQTSSTVEKHRETSCEQKHRNNRGEQILILCEDLSTLCPTDPRGFLSNFIFLSSVATPALS